MYLSIYLSTGATPDASCSSTAAVERIWHIQDSQGHILAHIRQSRPLSSQDGTYKTVKARF